MIAVIFLIILIIVIAVYMLVALKSNFGPKAGFVGSGEESQLTALINSAPIVVFSKSGCPYCKKVKLALEEANLEHITYELDKMKNGPKIAQELKKITNMATVPNVFAMGKHVGDSNMAIKMVKDWQDGKFKDLLHNQ